jgi:hypothetical protein
MCACAVFYYRVGQMERAPGVLLAGASVALFLLTGSVLGWGLVGCFLAQTLIFAGLWVRNMVRDPRHS